MSTPIEQNTAALEELLQIAESLPDSGGGSAEGAVLYTAQELTEEQKAQARENIDAAGQVELMEMAVQFNNMKSDLEKVKETLSETTGTVVDVSGETIVLTDSTNNKLEGLTLYGKTTQNGTPTPEAPVELVSAGDDGDITVFVNEQTLSVSTPNGLPGIPVSADGNYIDSNGQQWVCDEVDFARGVYVQRVNQILFKGTNEDWALKGTSENNYNNYRYQYWIGSDSKYHARTYTTPCINSHFSYQSSVNYDYNTVVGTMSHGSSIYVRLGQNTQYTDVNAFKNFLAEQYAAGTPMTHIYVLATPIETPLSAEQFAAYASLRTNYPNTTILNDDGAGMAVSYVASTKNYIDNQVSAVSAAILNL